MNASSPLGGWEAAWGNLADCLPTSWHVNESILDNPASADLIADFSHMSENAEGRTGLNPAKIADLQNLELIMMLLCATKFWGGVLYVAKANWYNTEDTLAKNIKRHIYWSIAYNSKRVETTAVHQFRNGSIHSCAFTQWNTKQLQWKSLFILLWSDF